MVLSLIAVIDTILIVIYANEPFITKYRNVLLYSLYFINILGVFILFFYFELLYLRVHKYYNKILDCVYGQKTASTVSVLSVNFELFENSGVEFYSFDALEWSDSKNDYIERTIICDAEFNLSFIEGQMIDVVTCGSMLIGYEVRDEKE